MRSLGRTVGSVAWTVASTRMSRFIAAPRERVYDALLDPEAIVRWKVPAGMTCEVHEFDATEGGTLGISLTYDARVRLTAAPTPTAGGSSGPYRTSWSSRQTSSRRATELVALHEGLPEGVPPADNEVGWRESLERLAALVE